MSKSVILYYAPEGCKKANKTKAVIVRLGVRLISVADTDISKTLAVLIGDEDIKYSGSGDDIKESTVHESFPEEEAQIPDKLTEEIMVFYNFTEPAFDRVLRELKKSHAAVSLKAVVTAVNISWPFAKLYAEISREREYIKKNS